MASFVGADYEDDENYDNDYYVLGVCFKTAVSCARLDKHSDKLGCEIFLRHEIEKGPGGPPEEGKTKRLEFLQGFQNENTLDKLAQPVQFFKEALKDCSVPNCPGSNLPRIHSGSYKLGKTLQIIFLHMTSGYGTFVHPKN